METVLEKIQGDCLVISRKLSQDDRLSLAKGEYFEACHAFKSSGTYKGEFEITNDMILDFAANFKAGIVRRWADGLGGFRIRADIEHWGPFAGWIMGCEVRDKKLSTGETVKALFLKCDVSADAVKAIKTQGKEYFSIEYYGNNPPYLDDQTGKQTVNVLTGGAFTDSPFCQEVAPMKMSTLRQKQEEAQKAQMQETEAQKQKKEELSKMKTIVMALGAAGIQLSAEASEEAICSGIVQLSKGREEAVKELGTAKAELVTVKKTLSDREAEIKTMKDEKAAELAKVREAKIKELSDKAVTDMKVSPAELSEKDPAKQIRFVKYLSLDDLSIAEHELELLPKKEAARGVEGNGAGALSAEEQIVAQARKLQEEAVKTGKSLSHAEAYEQAKKLASAKKA